jgi:Alkylmercury lyase
MTNRNDPWRAGEIPDDPDGRPRPGQGLLRHGAHPARPAGARGGAGRLRPDRPGPGRGKLERIARAGGANPAAVLAELAERDVIAFSQAGEIRAAYPFSPVHTPIRVSWPGGPTAYAMCAIDALGMSAMLGHPVTITAAEPDTGRVITVDVDGTRARWRPRTAVVFAGSAGDACRPSADRSCEYINFFASRRSARAWAGRHPEVTGRLLTQEASLGIGITEFGSLLRAGSSPSR